MTTNKEYTTASGDGWVEFFVDNGKAVVRAEAERSGHAALLEMIAASPALLAAAKNMVLAFDYGDSYSEMDALRQIKEAIAKAEPPRVIRRRVRVAVEVCVDVDVDATDEAAQRLAVGLVRDGEGQVVSHDLVS
jgi:hypothetical protein